MKKTRLPRKLKKLYIYFMGKHSYYEQCFMDGDFKILPLNHIYRCIS